MFEGVREGVLHVIGAQRSGVAQWEWRGGCLVISMERYGVGVLSYAVAISFGRGCVPSGVGGVAGMLEVQWGHQVWRRKCEIVSKKNKQGKGTHHPLGADRTDKWALRVLNMHI